MSGTWTNADVPAMWASAQEADTTEAWRQVQGWQTMYELLDQQQTALRLASEELAAYWPPDRSPAASAYLIKLEDMLATMDQAKRDAVSNRNALDSVLHSLAAAKSDLDELHRQWQQTANADGSTISPAYAPAQLKLTTQARA